jgi:hypothetical protein
MYATTRTGTGGNPKNALEMAQQQQQQQWQQQTNNNGGGQPSAPAWRNGNQQANVTFQGQPGGMPMQPRMTQQPMQQQQQFANFGGMCYPANNGQGTWSMGNVQQTMNGNQMGQNF